jgi:hypothetical protein
MAFDRKCSIHCRQIELIRCWVFYCQIDGVFADRIYSFVAASRSRFSGTLIIADGNPCAKRILSSRLP